MLDQSTGKDRDEKPPEREMPLRGITKAGDEHVLPEPFFAEDVPEDAD